MDLGANCDRRSNALDIASAERRVRVRRLAGLADVMLQNREVGDLARCGLDAALLRAPSRRPVCRSVTGVGQTVPRAHLPGDVTLVHALGGMPRVIGRPDGVPGGGPM